MQGRSGLNLKGEWAIPLLIETFLDECVMAVTMFMVANLGVG